MYPAESRPIPAKIRDGIAASIRALGPGQSFLIPQSDVKPTTRKVAHREAVRLSVPVSIRKVEDGLRVFRLDSWPRRKKSVRETIRAIDQTAYEASKREELVEDWTGWSDERTTEDTERGETITYRQHLKSGRRKEIRRESSW